MAKTQISSIGRVIECIIVLEGVLIIVFPFFQESQLDLAFFIIEPIAFGLGAFIILGSLMVEKSPWRIIFLYIVSILSIGLGIFEVLEDYLLPTMQQGHSFSLPGALWSVLPLYVFGIQLFLLALFLKRSITVLTIPPDQVVASASVDGTVSPASAPSIFSFPSINKKVLYIVLLNGAISWALEFLLKGATASITNSIIQGVVIVVLTLLPLVVVLFILKRVLASENSESLARRLALFYLIFNFITLGMASSSFFIFMVDAVVQSRGGFIPLIIAIVLQPGLAYCATKIFLSSANRVGNQSASTPGGWGTDKKTASILLVGFIVVFLAAGYYQQTAHPQQVSGAVDLSSPGPVLIDGRDFNIDGLRAEGSQVIWHSYDEGAQSFNDEILEFTPNASSTTGETLTITDFAPSQSSTLVHYLLNDSDAVVLNGQIYWIYDSDLYRYDSQSQKPVLMATGTLAIYGLSPENNELILASGTASQAGIAPADNYIPDAFYNLSSGLKGGIALSASSFDMNAIKPQDGSPPLVDGSYIYYRTQDGRIARYDINSNSNETFNIVPEEPTMAPRYYNGSGPFYDGVYLVAANDNDIAYYYWPNRAFGNVSGTQVNAYQVFGVYDIGQKKTVFERDFNDDVATEASIGIVGKIVGSNIYYAQRISGYGGLLSTTIREINLSSLQDVKLISIPNSFTSVGQPNWDVGDGYIVYIQRKPTQGDWSYENSGDLYFQKLTTSSSSTP